VTLAPEDEKTHALRDLAEGRVVEHPPAFDESVTRDRSAPN
jgi:hypothetical protein